MPSEMKRLKQLEEENAKLKGLVADRSLDEARPAFRLFLFGQQDRTGETTWLVKVAKGKRWRDIKAQQ